MRKLFPLLALLFAGCATAPDGGRGLSFEGQLAVETAVRIAIRHAVVDDPRAAAKVANIREIAQRVYAVTTAESTLAALHDEVIAEIDRLNLTPIERADAVDLLNLFAAALEGRLGPDLIGDAGVIRVREFLELVLGSLDSVTA